MNCEFCQSPVHIWFQCPKKPEGWKPARLAKKVAAPVKAGGPDQVLRESATAKKSTAARMDVQKLGGSTTLGDGEKKRSGETGNALVVDGLSDASKVAEISRRVSAGTQVLPVDTDNGEARAREFPCVAEAARAVAPKSNSAIKFDKKAWMRDYMRTVWRPRQREDRAKQRAAK